MTDNEMRGLQTQINSLGVRMEKGFDEIKAAINNFEKRVHSIELSEASCNPIVHSKIDAAWRKLEEHGVKLEKLETAVETMTHTNNILKWILGILTPVMVALVIKLVVGG